MERFKQSDGTYVLDGMTYMDAEALLMDALDFCACGCPEYALDYIKKSMELLDWDKERWPTWKAYYDDWRKTVDEHFASSGAEYFMWYFLDSRGLTEHGGSVPGWLTADGRELIEDIDYALAESKRN